MACSAPIIWGFTRSRSAAVLPRLLRGDPRRRRSRPGSRTWWAVVHAGHVTEVGVHAGVDAAPRAAACDVQGYVDAATHQVAVVELMPGWAGSSRQEHRARAWRRT